jgi:hypothetical protein
MKQNRRNARTPLTKFCVALTDTLSDSRTTVVVTSLTLNSDSAWSGAKPFTNLRTPAEYNATVPIANPRSPTR